MDKEEKKINITDGNEAEKISAKGCNKEKDQTNVEKKKGDREPDKKDPLAEANAKIEELKDKYLRSMAEFDNYKKRTLKEKAELILNGAEKTVTAVLPILDDMERALHTEGQAKDVKAMQDGLELIYKKFVKALDSLGVKKVETEGKDFDVDYHEAVAMVPGMGDDKKGKIIDCVQAGYTLNGKVIRHAKVAVGQ